MDPLNTEERGYLPGRIVAMIEALTAERDTLKALISKSSLIKVEAARAVCQGSDLHIESDGIMLVHKDDAARMEQRTRDLQKLAAKCREVEALKAANGELRDAGEGLLPYIPKDAEGPSRRSAHAVAASVFRAALAKHRATELPTFSRKCCVCGLETEGEKCPDAFCGANTIPNP